MKPRARELSEPLYFPSGGHQLFGWLHWPAGEQTSDMGLVLCKPFGYEAICGHRSMRTFADTAAGIGVPVLRFDYLGTGDSADGDPALGQLELWLQDVAAAAGELRRQSGVTRVCLLGFRLGALLAAAAAARGGVADALILVAPVLDGRRYLRELRITALAGAGAANASFTDKQAAAPGSMEVGGYTLSAATIAQLSQVNLTTLAAAPAAEMLIIDRNDLPAARAWSETLARLGARTRYEVLPGFVKMMMTPPQFAAVPQAMLEAMRSWLRTVASPARTAARSFGRGAQPPTMNVDLSLTYTGDHAPASERPVYLGARGELLGIVTEPASNVKRRGAAILVNSGADYHIGAARMYVSLARRWAGRGYVVLRMDLGGIGDSVTRPGRADDEVFPAAAIEDLQAAREFMRDSYGIHDVTLAGLCSGAYHVLRAAIEGLPVNCILMVNPQNFSWKEGMAVSDLQLVDVVKETRGYRDRWLSPATWKRLLRGEIDLLAVARVCLHSARIAAESGLRNVARRLHVRLPGDLGAELQDVVARGVRVVFVFARGEAGIELLRIQSGSAIGRLGDRCRVHILDSADHTFTQSAARARLEQLLSDELCAPPEPADEPSVARVS